MTEQTVDRNDHTAAKASLLVLAALRDIGPEWSPALLRDIDFAIEACRAALSASAPPAAPADVVRALERVARAICCPEGECRAAKHDEGFRSGKYILPMPCNWTSHKDEARAALSASAPQGVGDRLQPECPYCGTTKGLRKAGERPPDYICEQCFTPQDDGPCFDDLEPVEGTQ